MRRQGKPVLRLSVGVGARAEPASVEAAAAPSQCPSRKSPVRFMSVGLPVHVFATLNGLQMASTHSFRPRPSALVSHA